MEYEALRFEAGLAGRPASVLWGAAGEGDAAPHTQPPHPSLVNPTSNDPM